MTKLLEVLPVDGMCIRKLHTLAKQSLVKGKDPGFMQMQTCVYQVIGRCQVVFSVAAIYTLSYSNTFRSIFTVYCDFAAKIGKRDEIPKQNHNKL